MIVITGGAGFIGSNLIRSLNEEGESNIIIVEDIESFDFDDKWKNLIGLQYRDLIGHKQKSALEFFVKKSGIVIHLGAITSTECDDQVALFNSNYDFSKLLFSVAYTSKTHFIYASSAATYGINMPKTPFVDSLDVLHKLVPKNPYAFWKHRFDQWVYAEDGFANRNEYSDKSLELGWTTGLKFFNVYGPGESHKGRSASMVYHAIKKCINSPETPFKLYKSTDTLIDDGEQLRDFIYIDDVVKAIRHCMDNKGPKVCGLFNVGSGHTKSFNDLVSIVSKEFSNSVVPDLVKCEYVDMPDTLKDQYQNYTCADMSNFYNIAGEKWSAISLEEGVKKYTNHFKCKEIL